MRTCYCSQAQTRNMILMQCTMRSAPLSKLCVSLRISRQITLCDCWAACSHGTIDVLCCMPSMTWHARQLQSMLMQLQYSPSCVKTAWKAHGKQQCSLSVRLSTAADMQSCQLDLDHQHQLYTLTTQHNIAPSSCLCSIQALYIRT